MKFIKILKKPYVIGVFLLFILILVWLFIIPHGLANNGDFFRAIHNHGLSDISTSNSDNYFNYFVSKYRLSDDFIDNRADYFSTQSVIISAAVFLNNIFFHNGTFDIRFVSVIYAIIYLFTSFLILKLLSELVESVFKNATEKFRLTVTYIFTALYVFVLGDFSYLFYFNSFFGEPLSFTMLLLYVALTARIIISKNPSAFIVISYLLTIIMLVGGKQQNAPIGVLSALFLIRMITLKKENSWKYAMVASAVAVSAFSAFTYTSISGEIQYLGKYHTVTMGVMVSESSSEELKDIDLSPQLVLLKGTTAFNRYPMILISSPKMYTLMYNHATPVKIATYYITHPNALNIILDFVAHHSYEIKPDMVGNYLKPAGQPPLAKSYFFSLWSIIKNYIFPKSFGFILIFYAVIDGCLLVSYIRFLKERSQKKRLAIEFVLVIELMSLLQVAIAFIGGGESDLEKHLFLFNETFDMMFLFALFGIVYWIKKVRSK